MNIRHMSGRTCLAASMFSLTQFINTCSGESFVVRAFEPIPLNNDF